MASLRITGGTLRGRRVPVPPGEVRPTSERARQAFFNILGDRIWGARFLDLFAGSGIFSLEALSRGAASATAVDFSRKNMTSLAAFARSLDVDLRTIGSDVLTALRGLGADPFDVVYADPPYAYPQYDDLAAALSALPLSRGAVVAVEHRRRTEPFTDLPRGLALKRRAEYGEVWISLLTPSPPATPLADEES